MNLVHPPAPTRTVIAYTITRDAIQDRNWELDAARVGARLPSFGSRNGFVFGTCALSPALVEQCFADGKVHPLTWNRHTPAYAVARLARHPAAEVRALIAARPDVGPELVAELREDRTRACGCARLHPLPRTWAECWAIRRVAASWPGLSAELAETLAQDDDEEVRIRLACHHPLAPPPLLLDVFVTRPAHRPHLLALPAFLVPAGLTSSITRIPRYEPWPQPIPRRPTPRWRTPTRRCAGQRPPTRACHRKPWRLSSPTSIPTRVLRPSRPCPFRACTHSSTTA